MSLSQLTAKHVETQCDTTRSELMCLIMIDSYAGMWRVTTPVIIKVIAFLHVVVHIAYMH